MANVADEKDKEKVLFYISGLVLLCTTSKMATTWLPNNIAPFCLEQQAPLTQCSLAGCMFLSLVVRLFGGVTYSINYPKPNPYSSHQLTHPPLTTNHPDVTSLAQCHPSYYSREYKQLYTHSISISPQPPLYRVSQNPSLSYFQRLSSNLGFKFEQEETENKKPVITYDFIIVGAGSAGCVLANRLSEVKKWRVLLLEAGSEEPDVTMVPSLTQTLRGSSIDWNYRTQPEPTTCRAFKGQTCQWPRGRTMGGSSAINYMVYMRGNRLDYDQWAELGNPGWSYNELLPYFKKSENIRAIEAYDTHYHGVDGPITVERYSHRDANTIMIVKAFNESGLPIIDLTGENNIGTNIGLSTSRDGRRISMNVAYIKPIRDIRPNIDIIVNAFVSKLLIDPETKTVLGVNYVKNLISYNVFAKKEVIVSSGSLNSPKLLMLSGIGPKPHLESLNIPVIADLAVGQNLQEHVCSEGLTLTLSNKTSTLINNQDILQEIVNYHQQKPGKSGPLSTTSSINGIGFIKTKYASVNAPDIQYLFEGRNIHDLYSDPATYLETNVYPLSFYDSLAVTPILLTPKSRGSVLLNNTDPVYGQPLIYSGFYTAKQDMDVMIEGLRYAVRLEETEAFKQNDAHFFKVPIKKCESYIWGSYDYFACILMEYTTIMFHPVGTCKMGPIWDKDAVVDPRLRVYGVNRLRVIDASIMPFIVRGNTNIPTVAIAERASDMIKEDYKPNKPEHIMF